MSSNTENIEAKLCAYVDGDLDEQGKLEIEKHLQQNPQHRMLLEELKQTKSMMQALPREAAPPELAETIHGQLERSVLLDGVGTDDVAATMKINRWPQMMAVAAVLILATGLGILVYVVLPKHADNPIAFDPAPKAAATETTRGTGDKSAATELGAIGRNVEEGARFPEEPAVVELARSDEAKMSKGAFKAEGKDGTFARSPGTLTLDGPPANTPVVANASKAGESALNTSGARRVLIVLKTDNVAETNGQVASYLETNKIAWSPAAPAERELVLASRFRDTSVQLRNNEGNVANTVNVNGVVNNTTAGVAGNNAFNSGNENISGGSKVASKSGNDDLARNTYQMPQAGRGGNEILQSQQQLAVPKQEQDQPQVSQTQAAAAPMQPAPTQPAPMQPGLTLNQPAGQQAAAGLDRSFVFNDADATRQNVIVARNLSREQAVMMVDSIGKLYAGQTAVVLDRDVLDTLPVGQLKQAEDALAASTTQPSTTQPAATGPEAQQTWADSPAVQMGEQAQPRKENATTLPAGAAPPIPELAFEPTTRPVEGDALGGGGSQPYFNQQAAELDLKGQSTTRPAELQLEVMIVVQSAAAAEVPPGVPAQTQTNPGGQAEPVVVTPPAPAAPATQPGVDEAVPPPADMPQAK
jgi:hypothetical protein